MIAYNATSNPMAMRMGGDDEGELYLNMQHSAGAKAVGAYMQQLPDGSSGGGQRSQSVADTRTISTNSVNSGIDRRLASTNAPGSAVGALLATNNADATDKSAPVKDASYYMLYPAGVPPMNSQQNLPISSTAHLPNGINTVHTLDPTMQEGPPRDGYPVDSGGASYLGRYVRGAFQRGLGGIVGGFMRKVC